MRASERLLDVSTLEPCEPLERTLAAVAELGPGEVLRVLHRREPFPLYPMLERLGCAWRIQTGTTTPFELLIWRADDPVAAAAAAG
jgi:uncharacterized protein (DUF2249 family)